MQQNLGITSLPLVSNFLLARNRDRDRDLLMGDPSNTGIHYGIGMGMGIYMRTILRADGCHAFMRYNHLLRMGLLGMDLLR